MDANNFITGWQVYYPPSVFPSLWNSIEANKNRLILIKPIYDEIEPMNSSDVQKTLQELAESHPIKAWLIQQNFQPVTVKDDVEAVSLALERKYEIPPNNQAGASKNDITLIAYAKVHRIPVVTFERKQRERPPRRNRYRIPLICQDEDVECMILPECLEGLNISV